MEEYLIGFTFGVIATIVFYVLGYWFGGLGD